MGRQTLASHLTRCVMWLCGGLPYTHLGVALWQSGRLYLVEETGGGDHLTPLSQWRYQRWDVARPLVAVPEDDVIQAAVDAVLEDHVPYGIWTFCAIGVRRLFGIDIGGGSPVCSSFAVSLLARLGWSPAGLEAMPAPDEVMALAGPVIVSVDPGRF